MERHSLRKLVTLQEIKLIAAFSCTIIELLVKEAQDSREFVGHFFCSHSDKSRLEATDLFRSYIKQMLSFLDTTEQSYPSEVASCLRHYFGQRALCLTLDEIIAKIFIPLSRLLQHGTYIVDGLDECPAVEVHKVLKVFRKLQSDHDLNLRIFISGRESLDVSHSIPGSSTIYISNQNAKRDICEFIEWKIEDKMCERRLTDNEDILQVIKTTLLDKADRMWVLSKLCQFWCTLTNLEQDLMGQPTDRVYMGRMFYEC